jgi:hypothetical protein
LIIMPVWYHFRIQYSGTGLKIISLHCNLARSLPRFAGGPSLGALLYNIL